MQKVISHKTFLPFINYLYNQIQMEIKYYDKFLPSRYMHQTDLRSPLQKKLSTQIYRKLSDFNLERIKQRKVVNHQLRFQYVFLCLTGFPPFENEYGWLELPFQKIVFTSSLFEKYQSDEKFKKEFAQASFEKQADKLAILINSIPYQYKIVVIFHSFGTAFLNSYFKRYGQARIAGFIDIAGFPITMYQLLVPMIQQSLKIKNQDWDNIQYVQEKYREGGRKRGYSHVKDKHFMAIYMKLIQQQFMQQLFDWTRKYPKILKLIISGRKDRIISEQQMGEKAIYYSYSQKLGSMYEQKLRKAYKRIYGVSTDNVQEKFVFNFEKAAHSIYMQKKLTPDLNLIISHYLAVIDHALEIQTPHL